MRTHVLSRRAVLASILGLSAISSLRAEDDRPVVDDKGVPREIAANPNLPTIYLVGDSTVKSGGKGGMFGWGERIAPFFDPAKTNVVNHAIGGRSSRTFVTEGRWDAVSSKLKKGDFVIVQFGHNDAGPIDAAGKFRGSLPGTGPETREVVKPDGATETVRTFGWYMSKISTEARAKGAAVVICSPVPHKTRWETGRDFADHAKWDAAVAKASGAAFIDLTVLVSEAYHKLGKDKVETLFADKGTHTSEEGARINAACVVSGLRTLPGDPFAAYLSAQGKALAPAGK